MAQALTLNRFRERGFNGWNNAQCQKCGSGLHHSEKSGREQGFSGSVVEVER